MKDSDSATGRKSERYDGNNQQIKDKMGYLENNEKTK